MDYADTRPEIVVAALLHLLTAYRTRRTPVLAACIARHFDCLAAHPATQRAIRDIAARSAREWDVAARIAAVASLEERPPGENSERR